MTSSLAVSSDVTLPPAWHDEFLTELLPTLRAQAGFCFRHLPCVEREEALAESIATALVFFLRLVDQGRNPRAFAGRIAQIAVLRVKSGRLVCSGARSQDVLSRLARQRRGFKVASFDDPGDQPAEGWQDALVESRKVTPAETAASRLDFGAWLGAMTSRRRQIAETLAAGYGTCEVAEKFRLSRSRVSQFRREFEDSWRAFQREIPRERPDFELAAT